MKLRAVKCFLSFYKAATKITVTMMLIRIISLLIVISIFIQDVSGQASCEAPADIVFAMDVSGSVGSTNWARMQTFVKDFVEEAIADPNDNRDGTYQFGITSFGTDAELEARFGDWTTLDEWNRLVDGINYDATSTNIAGGINVAVNDIFNHPQGGNRAGVPDILIVMTDGEPTVDEPLTIPAAENARASPNDIIVFTIGIGSGVQQRTLNEIAGDPSRAISVDDFEELIQQVLNILNVACRAASGAGCSREDITFVLDSSGSIGNRNWDLTKQFVEQFINRLGNIGPNGNQVGMVTFSTMGTLNWDLQRYFDRNSVVNAVNQLSWFNHRTNIADALRNARQGTFDAPGNRPDAPDIVIALSDGFANEEVDMVPVESALLKDQGVRMFSIGVGEKLSMPELDTISSKPYTHHKFLLEDYDDLVQRVDDIYNAICGQSPPAPDYSGGRSDIVFVVENSRNVGSGDWDNVIQFLSRTAGLINIGSNDYRIGVVTFSDFARTEADLNRYRSTQDFQNGIQQIRYNGGGSRPSEGVREATDRVFTGRRNNFNQVLVLVLSANTRADSSLENAIQFATNQNIFVLIVRVGDVRGDDGFRELASPGGAFYITFTSYNELALNYEDVLSAAAYTGAQEIWQCGFEVPSSSPDGSPINSQSAWCGIDQTDRTISDTFDWTLLSGPTPSVLTGPSRAAEGVGYAYIEATGRINGADAVLFLPVDNSLQGVFCVGLMSSMYGFHTGNLQVITTDNNGRPVIRWNRFGPQIEAPEMWVPRFVEVVVSRGQRIGIRAIRRTGYSSDIAIDNVRLTQGPCPSRPTI